MRRIRLARADSRPGSSGSQGRLEVGGDLGGFVCQLVAGDADRAVARGDETAVAVAVVAEGAAGAVGGEAVELDDDALGRPEAVDLVVFLAEVDRGVEARAREVEVVQEGEEDVLEGTAGAAAGVGGLAGQRYSGRPGSAVTWVAIEEGGHGEVVVQPMEFDVADGDLDGVDVGGRGEVEDGARDGRHRDAVDGGALVVRELGEMAADGAAGPSSARRGDVDEFSAAADAPESGGRVVAQRCARAAAENGGYPATALGQGGVADRVDAGVEADQAPKADAADDLVPPETERQQLAPRHHPVLPSRQLANELVPSVSSRLVADSATNCELTGHASSVPNFYARVAR